jgi:hypothetical protein
VLSSALLARATTSVRRMVALPWWGRCLCGQSGRWRWAPYWQAAEEVVALGALVVGAARRLCSAFSRRRVPVPPPWFAAMYTMTTAGPLVLSPQSADDCMSQRCLVVTLQAE